MKLQKIRQPRKNRGILVLFIVFGIPLSGFSQNNSSSVDYSIRSNLLWPDTISDSDMKKVFWHFVDYSHEEIKNLEADFIKVEFEKLGITTNERARFVSAFIFFDTTMKNHKLSCQQWSAFKDLKP